MKTKTASISAAEFRQLIKKKRTTGKSEAIKQLLQDAGIQFVQEHKFHPVRKWRFDFAIPERMIAIEYEGINSSKSRHTSITGFTNDSEKYNQAQLMGWKVLRYTALNYKKVIEDLK